MTPLRRMLRAAGALVAGYLTVVRPRILRWGADREEARRLLPGDEVIPRARMQSTRAVTIQARPGDVWPWLVQLGQGRGGLYSYDWLENLFGCDIHSVERVVPELQRLQVGDEIRLVRQGYPVDLRFQVSRIEPMQSLVLSAPASREESLGSGLPFPTWTFVLEPMSRGRTRLLSRWRSDFAPTPAGYLWNKYGIEPVNFVMERKMLKGIKERAERSAVIRSEPLPAREDEAIHQREGSSRCLMDGSTP
ncbi:MAG TPA: hypothetical protein VK977_07780 [Actinomycetota bacterium]|nr:hypothetical protein [Actinomycetota bacterium]